MSHGPADGVLGLVAAQCAGLDGIGQMAAELWVLAPDARDGVAHAHGDGLARPVGVVTQPSGPTAHPDGRSQLGDQKVPFSPRAVTPGQIVVAVRFGDVVVEVGQPRAVRGARLLVEHVGAM